MKASIAGLATNPRRYPLAVEPFKREVRHLVFRRPGSKTAYRVLLMAQYTNVPMDLADASLVAVAESRSYRRVFTIDNDFYVYRLADGSFLEVVR